MPPQAIISETPFLSRAIFSPVGAYGAETGATADAGAAYLYQLEANGSATYLTKVTAPDANASDVFGHSVSQSGNILAVGAHQADPGGTNNAGAAYLYQLEANGSATYLTKVTAPDATRSDYFGISVSQSGNILAVGAYQADPGGTTNAGAAYLYQLEANGSATYLTKVTAPDANVSDFFGLSVSQSGNILAVGAYQADPGGTNNAGAAYLYQLEANGSATYLTKVTAPDANASDVFGYSVSQSGNILAVGAYQADPGGTTNAGAAYLYQLEANGSATYLTKVTAPDANASDVFGISVSQSGNILAVGLTQLRRGARTMLGPLICINWKQMGLRHT
jgi:preprotein translocase subunit SecG